MMLEQGSSGVNQSGEGGTVSTNQSTSGYSLPLEAPPTDLSDPCHWNCEVTAYYQLHLLSLAGKMLATII